MQAKYCIIPDREKLFAFLSAQSLSPTELMQLQMMHISKICIDESSRLWEVHFDCAAHIRPNVMQAAAAKLAVAFSLEKVDFICDLSLIHI